MPERARPGTTHASAVITDVRPWGGASTDVLIDDGHIVALAPRGLGVPGSSPANLREINGQGRLLLPAFSDVHLHLDSTRLGLPFRPHTGGTLLTEQVINDRRHWRQAERSVAERAIYTMGVGIAHGATHARSYAQIDSDCRLERFEGVLAAREAHRDRAELEVVAFPQAGIIKDPGTADLLEAALRQGADWVGGIDPCALDEDPRGQLDLVFALAEKHQVGVDIHLHEPGELGRFSVAQIVQRTKSLGMHHRVVISHAFCLHDAPDRELESTLDALADLDIALTTAAPPRTPLPLQALAERRIRVGLGQDGQRDYWAPYGNGDMLDRTWQLAWSNGFVHDRDIELCLAVATIGGRSLMSGPADSRPQLTAAPQLAVGDAADFVLVDGETPTAAVMDRRPRRTVIHRGVVVAHDGQVTS